MNSNYCCNTPVVLFVFKRLDTVKMIFDTFKKVKPTKLYVFSDGYRKNIEHENERVCEVREYIRGAVDWDCQFIFECSDNNKGCTRNITEGLNSVFEKEEQAIIFEDDAVPSQ